MAQADTFIKKATNLGQAAVWVDIVLILNTMKTYAAVRERVIHGLNITHPDGEGPNGEILGAKTIPFEPLSKPEINDIIEAAAADGIVASWDDWLNHSDDYTNISFEKKSAQ